MKHSLFLNSLKQSRAFCGNDTVKKKCGGYNKKKGVDFTFVVKTKEGLNKRSSADDCLEAFHWRYGENIPMLL